MGKYKQQVNKQRQDFLNSFFSDELHYDVKEVNNFVLEKQINGVTGQPIIAIYTKKAWKEKQSYLQKSLNDDLV
jgi:hypothetical protein